MMEQNLEMVCRAVPMLGPTITAASVLMDAIVQTPLKSLLYQLPTFSLRLRLQ